jgi:DNA-binding IscR family transcriptional regulator
MIKLSKKGDYGLKAMVYLAKKHNQLVKISEISENL